MHILYINLIRSNRIKYRNYEKSNVFIQVKYEIFIFFSIYNI